MPEEKNALLSWKVPEHVRHQRGRLWYFMAFFIGAVLVIYGVLTNNFLFALIIILFAIVSGLMHMQEPVMIDFFITTEGVALGGKNIDYKDITSFWIVNDPGSKSLHLRTRVFLMPLLSIPFGDVDAGQARSALLKYVKEDEEEKEEPLLEVLSRKLKL